jgi:hypothetical protein
MTTTFKNFPQGLLDGTNITAGLTTTSGDRMVVAIGGDLYADSSTTFASQGHQGQVWRLTNSDGGLTNASFPGSGSTLNETSAIAVKMSGMWLASMPNVLQRIIDIRNTSAGTICRVHVTTSNFVQLQTNGGATTPFTSSVALVHDFEYRFELGFTLAASGATVNFDVYLGNNPAPISGLSYSSSAAVTGTGAINNVTYMQGNVPGGGVWQAFYGGFEAVTGSATEIGPFVATASRPRPIKVYSQAVKRAGTW